MNWFALLSSFVKNPVVFLYECIVLLYGELLVTGANIHPVFELNHCVHLSLEILII